jgi:hypothetical protein
MTPKACDRRVGSGRVAAALVLTLALSGCTGGDGRSAPAPDTGASATGAATATPSPSGSLGAAIAAEAVEDLLPTDLQAETYFDMDRATWQRQRQAALAQPWRIVALGGVEYAAACDGSGEPTVVYIDGWDSPAADAWSLAAAEQATSTRVCLFDRPGMGLAPPRPGAAPHSTPEQHAEEMLAVLAVLGESGPYVLVPWSYGGLVARAAAVQHPDEVAGMVLVDATSPLQSGLDEPWNGENGIVDTNTVATTVGGGPDMGDRPVIVLEAGVFDPEIPKAFVEEWHELQRQASSISDNAVHATVDDSDHAIPYRNPALVVAATTAVAESIRTGNAPLPPCPDALGANGASCVTD